MCSKLTIKIPEQQNQGRFVVLIVNFGQTSHVVLVLFFFTLNTLMSTLLNFNLFGNVLHRKQKKQRRISKSHIIYDEVLCGNIMSGSHCVLTKQVQLRWCMNHLKLVSHGGSTKFQSDHQLQNTLDVGLLKNVSPDILTKFQSDHQLQNALDVGPFKCASLGVSTKTFFPKIAQT